MAVEAIAELIDTLHDLGEISQVEALLRRRKPEICAEADVQPAKGSSQQVRSLQNQIAYQRKKRLQAEELIEETLPRKQHTRIAAIWYLRAALARPSVPVSAIVEVLRDFSLDADARIRETSVRKAKDAMCGLVLAFNREGISRSMQALASDKTATVTVTVTDYYDYDHYHY